MNRQDLRAWAKRMGLGPAEAARALGLTRSAWNAKIYGTRPVDRRTLLLAAYYEADPVLAEGIIHIVDNKGAF